MGHVGKNKYLPMTLAIKAKDVKDAAKIAKKKPGVKRNHKDWCLEIPVEITYDQYIKQSEINRSDPYSDKKTRQNLKLFRDRIVDEDNYSRHIKIYY